MSRRRRLSLAIVAVIAAVACWKGSDWVRQYRVSHHRDRLKLATQHKLADAPAIDKLPIVRSFFPSRPPYVDRNTWEYEQAATHRAALVELGELAFEHFHLQHLRHATPEGRHFSLYLLKTTHLLDVYWEGPWSAQPVPMTYKFWCERGEMDSWRRFFAKYDVPNYWEIRDQSVTLPDPKVE